MVDDGHHCFLQWVRRHHLICESEVLMPEIVYKIQVRIHKDTGATMSLRSSSGEGEFLYHPMGKVNHANVRQLVEEGLTVHRELRHAGALARTAAFVAASERQVDAYTEKAEAQK